MKKLQNKKGFTLIELLVVITIIGILATGGISVFTKQLQGARDTTRINNLKLLETANIQYNNDNGYFPTDASTGAYSTAVSGYMSKFPVDPKVGQNVCFGTGSNNSTSNQACGIWYGVDADTYGLTDARFKLGTTFEKSENASPAVAQSNKDGGTINGMLEIFAGEGGSGTTLSLKIN